MGRDRKPPADAVDDPSIYAYDEVYDSMKAAEKRARAALDPHGKSRQPRYINNLLKVAEARRNEQTLIKERKIQREREAEGDQFADKETFVTSA
ncbi:hypothetical protein H4R35_007219 [Dimargaris xerosporica]|nr:hypothetical protein H4R35_007219 [Dimargaris xerosporica]